MSLNYSWLSPLAAFMLTWATAGCRVEAPGGDEVVDPWHALAPCDLSDQVDSVIESRLRLVEELETTDSLFAGIEYGGARCDATDVPSLTVLVAIDEAGTADEQKLYYRAQGDPNLNPANVFNPPVSLCGGARELRVRQFSDTQLMSDIEHDLVSALANCQAATTLP